MKMVIPNEGKIEALQCLLQGGDVTSGEDWDIQLYKNDYTPVDASTVGDFVPADFAGSGVFTVTEPNWSTAIIALNVAVSTNSDTPSWTSTDATPQTVYGWFAVGVTSGVVRAAQRFDTPRTLALGDTETLDPFAVRLKTFT